LSFARPREGFTSPPLGASLPPSPYGLGWLLSSHWSLVVDGFVLPILGLWSFWSISVLDLVRMVFLCCFGANVRIFQALACGNGRCQWVSGEVVFIARSLSFS